MKPIDAKQIQLIHIARAQLGLSEDDYRTIILAQTKNKKDSSKELTYFEADGLIKYFKMLGFKIKSNAARRARRQPANDRKRARPLPGNVIVLPTRDQMDMIEVLAGKIAWRVEDGFKLWMRKYLKIERIKTVEDAQRVIEGLKGMLQHQSKGTPTWKNG